MSDHELSTYCTCRSTDCSFLTLSCLFSGATTDWAKITYDTTGTDYCLDEVQAYLGDSIPLNNQGNPSIGNFPAKAVSLSTSSNCVKTWTVNTVLSKTCCASTTYTNWATALAAHSHVTLSNGSGGQTAWTPGIEMTAGGSWATNTPIS